MPTNESAAKQRHICYLPIADYAGQYFICRCGLIWEWSNDDQQWENCGRAEEVTDAKP